MKGLIQFEPNKFYHIVNHAVGNENLFRNDENFRFFLRKYAHYMPTVCSTFAYCLMPNHIHFLIKTYSKEDLIKHPKFKNNFHKLVMQELSNLLNSYSKAYNKIYERRGALWIDFTKRFAVETDEYLAATINYIHQNPVKHGFCKEADDWKFSSFNTILSEKSTLVSRSELIEWFGGIEKYIEFHKMQKVSLWDDYEF